MGPLPLRKDARFYVRQRWPVTLVNSTRGLNWYSAYGSLVRIVEELRRRMLHRYSLTIFHAVISENSAITLRPRNRACMGS